MEPTKQKLSGVLYTGAYLFFFIVLSCVFLSTVQAQTTGSFQVKQVVGSPFKVNYSDTTQSVVMFNNQELLTRGSPVQFGEQGSLCIPANCLVVLENIQNPDEYLIFPGPTVVELHTGKDGVYDNMETVVVQEGLVLAVQKTDDGRQFGQGKLVGAGQKHTITNCPFDDFEFESSGPGIDEGLTSEQKREAIIKSVLETVVKVEPKILEKADLSNVSVIKATKLPKAELLEKAIEKPEAEDVGDNEDLPTTTTVDDAPKSPSGFE